MNAVINFFSAYFNAQTPLAATLEAIVFIIGIYGIFKLFLFLLRYYIIYTLAKKLLSLWKQIKFKPSTYTPPPSNKEDEMLRDEEKEREAEKVEKVEVIKMQKAQNVEQEQDFKIIMPKAIGKWQKLVLGQRQNLILAVAQKMQSNRSSNFWQNYVEVQKEQSGQGRSNRM